MQGIQGENADMDMVSLRGRSRLVHLRSGT